MGTVAASIRKPRRNEHAHRPSVDDDALPYLAYFAYMVPDQQSLRVSEGDVASDALAAAFMPGGFVKSR